MTKLVFPAFILLTSMVLLINGCEKEEDPCLNPYDTVSGIVVSDYNFGECVATLGLLNQNYIITDKEDFQGLALLPSDKADCKSNSIQSINFDRYSLLGVYADTACEGMYERNVEKDLENKKYIYSVSHTQCGSCEGHDYSMNWVLVPKLPEGYTVEFRTI